MAATPVDDGSAAGWPRSVPQQPVGGYRPIRRLGQVASGLIALSAVVGASDLMVRGAVYGVAGLLLASPSWLPLEHVYPRTHEWTSGTLPAVEDVLRQIRNVWLLVLFVAGAVFIVWLSRAATNLRESQSLSARLWPALAVSWLVVLVPALVVVDSVLDGWQRPMAVPFVVLICMAAPVLFLRRLWIAGSAGPGVLQSPNGPSAVAWRGIVVWWAAFTSFLIASRLTVYMLDGLGEADSMVDTSTRVLAIGASESVAGVSLAIAGYCIIRIIFGVNSMQDALARTLPKPTPLDLADIAGTPALAAGDRLAAPPAPPTVRFPPARHTAVQWQCQSCEYMNPTALRFCQNCARERA